jgi:hypothetical protein
VSTPDDTDDSTPRAAPVMPTADEAAAAGLARADAPRVVRVGFWVWIAAGLIGVVGAVLFLVLRDEWADLQLRNNPGQSASEIRGPAAGLSWWLLSGSVMFLAFFVLLAHNARRGVRKARTLLSVLGIFAALFEYSLGRVTIYGLVSALLVIVAVGLSYAPPARRFFAEADL